MMGEVSKMIDLKKQFKHLYTASAKQPQVVDVPPLSYLAINGRGDPNTAQEYQDALAALYGLSYALKFGFKKQGVDYPIMPLEGLWWVEDISQFDYGDKSNWQWMMMIMQPEIVNSNSVERACAELSRKKDLISLPKIRLETYHEGTSTQIMHLGPFSAEPPTIDRLHRFIDESGYVINNRHHEIYLSDFRRAAPEKLKTIIRYPVSKKPG